MGNVNAYCPKCTEEQGRDRSGLRLRPRQVIAFEVTTIQSLTELWEPMLKAIIILALGVVLAAALR